jgi:hypothetical protein
MQAALQEFMSSGAAACSRLSRNLASLLNTCLKILVAAAEAQQQQQQQQQPRQREDDKLCPQLLVLAKLGAVCSQLGALVCEGSSSKADEAGSAWQWVALTAKCLLFSSKWLQQQPAAAMADAAYVRSAILPKAPRSDGGRNGGQSRVFDTASLMSFVQLELLARSSPPLAASYIYSHSRAPFMKVLSGCQCMLEGVQLLLARTELPRAAGQQPGAAAAASSAAQKAQQQLPGVKFRLQCNATTLRMFFNVTSRESAAVVQEELAKFLRECTQGSSQRENVNQEWKQLQDFAASLFDECAVAGSCGNPDCISIDKLSEWQLAGSKCVSCGIAHYCSRACQKVMWVKRHKPVCKRLQGVTAA